MRDEMQRGALAGTPLQNNQNASDRAIVANLIDQIKATLMGGGSISPGAIPSEHRPHFWSAIQVVKDEIPVRSVWRTVEEQHVDGLRLRERVFKLRIRGSVDPVLAGWLCVAAVSLIAVVRGCV